MINIFLITIGAIAITAASTYYIFKKFFEEKLDHQHEIYQGNISDMAKSHYKRLEEIKKDGKKKAARSLKRSKAVLNGNAAEQLVPYMEDFPYYPGDARFLGSPNDLVVFDGITSRDECDKIVFVEVKTGRSRLNKRQKAIKECIQRGDVDWLEYRVDTPKIELKHKPKLAELDECLCKDCIEE